MGFKKDNFKKEIFFVLAAVGAAAGLGNLWRFPYIAYENGGGAFLIPYFICLLGIGIPLLMMEISIGVWSKKSVAGAFKKINKKWTWIGWWSLANSMVIVFYYSVILAWSIQYIFYSISQSWGKDTSSFFTGSVLNLSSSPFEFGGIRVYTVLALLFIWFLIYLITKSGTKTLSKILLFTVPIPLIILVVLAINGAKMEGGAEGINFFLKPDFSKLSSIPVWVAAASQVVLSLSLGLGQIIGYASRKKDASNIIKSSVSIALLNTLFSILAGISVFAVVGFYANNQGVSITDLKLDGIFLAFSTYPTAISQLPYSAVWGVLFFVMLVLLGIDSAFAVIEANISGFEDFKSKKSKKKIALILSLIGFIGGIIFTSNSGLYWLDIVDHWVAYYAVGAIIILQIIVFGYSSKFNDIFKTIGNFFNSSLIFNFIKIWTIVIIPIILIFLFGSNFIKEFTESYGDYDNKALLIGGWGSLFTSLIVGIIIAKYHNKRNE